MVDEAVVEEEESREIDLLMQQRSTKESPLLCFLGEVVGWCFGLVFCFGLRFQCFLLLFRYCVATVLPMSCLNSKDE